MKFDWDIEKANINIAKHGMHFEDAQRIFTDPIRETVEDTRFRYGEPRFITTGFIGNRLCVVVYTERGDITRIISARKANNREQKQHANRSKRR